MCAFCCRLVDIVNSAHNRVLRLSGEEQQSPGDDDKTVSTVKHGSHAENDCFIAHHCSMKSIQKLEIAAAVLDEVGKMQQLIQEYNEQHGKELVRQYDAAMNKKDEWESKLRGMAFTKRMEEIVETDFSTLFESLIDFMCSLFPGIDQRASRAEIVDFTDEVCDIELLQIASGMGIVKALIDLYKVHLFKTPCVLFGGPDCFHGQEPFLAIRLSFRLMGIICAKSEMSAQVVFADLDWVTDQVGLGRFKAAEAMSSVLVRADGWMDGNAEQRRPFLPSFLPSILPSFLPSFLHFIHPLLFFSLHCGLALPCFLRCIFAAVPLEPD